MSILGIDIPDYNEADNPTNLAENTIIDWSINRTYVMAVEKMYKAKCKGVKKKRSLIKRNKDDSLTNEDNSKIIKLEIKQENHVENTEIKTAIEQDYDNGEKGILLNMNETN